MLDALAAIALWSTLALLGLKLRGVPPFLLVGSALLLGSVFGLRKCHLRGVRPSVLLLGVYGLFAYHFCLFVALRLAPPVEANLINYLWPLLIVLFTPVITGGPGLRARHVGGAVLGFCGAALLVSGGHLRFHSSAAAGYALALAAAVIWSTYSLLTKRIGDFPTSTIALFCLVSGSLSLLCHALFEPRYLFRSGELPYLLVIGLGPMGGAFYLWDRALKRGDPRTVGTLAYLTPLASTSLLALFGGGHLEASSVIAAGMIMGGAVIGTWRSGEARPAAESLSSPSRSGEP